MELLGPSRAVNRHAEHATIDGRAKDFARRCGNRERVGIADDRHATIGLDDVRSIGVEPENCTIGDRGVDVPRTVAVRHAVDAGEVVKDDERGISERRVTPIAIGVGLGIGQVARDCSRSVGIGSDQKAATLGKSHTGRGCAEVATDHDYRSCGVRVVRVGGGSIRTATRLPRGHLESSLGLEPHDSRQQPHAVRVAVIGAEL